MTDVGRPRRDSLTGGGGGGGSLEKSCKVIGEATVTFTLAVEQGGLGKELTYEDAEKYVKAMAETFFRRVQEAGFVDVSDLAVIDIEADDVSIVADDDPDEPVD